MTPLQRETVDAILAAGPDRLERVVALEVARVGYAPTVGRLLLATSEPDYHAQRAQIERALEVASRLRGVLA